MLVLETRMGNIGQLFGKAIFEDALLDLDAGRGVAARAGLRHVVLSGYSSGATMATRFAAVAPPAAPARAGLPGQPVGAAPVDARARRPLGRRAAATRRSPRRGAGDRPAGSRRARPTGCSWCDRSRGPSRRAARQRDLHLAHLVAPRGARTPSRPCPSADRRACGRRSCWCRAPTTRWSRPRRPSGWPRSPARPATPTSRSRRSRASGTFFAGGEIARSTRPRRWLARRA